MTTYQSTFANFKNYIRQPEYRQPLADLSGNSLVKTIRLFLKESTLILGLVLASVSMIVLMQYTTGEGFFRPLVEKYSSSIGTLLAALVMVVIAQEAIFRAILRLTVNRIRNIAALLLLIPVGQWYRLLQGSTNELALLWPILAWLLAIYLLKLYLKQPAVFDRINAFWQANFRWVFYTITLLCAFFKISDDLNVLTHWQQLLVPVLFMVGLINSSYLGYVRMKYGFWYAVVVHTLILTAMLTPEIIRVL